MTGMKKKIKIEIRAGAKKKYAADIPELKSFLSI